MYPKRWNVDKTAPICKYAITHAILELRRKPIACKGYSAASRYFPDSSAIPAVPGTSYGYVTKTYVYVMVTYGTVTYSYVAYAYVTYGTVA